MTRRIKITDREALFSRVWAWCWKNQQERGESHVSASDLHNRIRADLTEQLDGSEYGSHGADVWRFGGVRVSGFSLSDCRTWLRRQVERGALSVYLPRPGIISGARFRPVGVPLTKAEQKAVDTPPEEKRRQRWIRHHKGADGRPVCMANIPKRSPNWRGRWNGRPRFNFTSEGFPEPTCKRCAKLPRPVCTAALPAAGLPQVATMSNAFIG